MTFRHLVVGVDGSEPSASALAWATAQAGPPHVVALAAVDPVSELIADALQVQSTGLVQHVQEQLDGPWTEAVRAAGAEIDGRVRHDDPARALLDEAERVGADAIVVGSHSHRRWSPASVGSIITKLSHRSEVPIVVVPPGGERASGPIVVGIDGSDTAAAALDWAVAHATAAGLPVHAVRVFDRLAYGTELAFARVDLDDLRPAILGDLDTLAGRQGPGTTVRTELLDGAPAETLVHRSQTASALVLGRRRTPTDVVTGSVARACVAHAVVPTVLVAG